MPVDTQHPEYGLYADKWKTMRDIGDEDAVKKEKTRYLPGFYDQSGNLDETRYAAYILRANFVTYTARTSSGLNGAIFRKDPTIKLPSTLEYMKEDADGSGQGLTQFSKELSKEQLDVARAGVLLDRPVALEGSTREDDLKNNLRSNLSIYKTESIINWKTLRVGGATILTMVVLVESVDVEEDDFKTETEKQYRVLALDEQGYYYQEIYDAELKPQGAIYPKKKDGSNWTLIPFWFVGAEDNTVSVDEPQLYGMAKVNLAHYRNSADYEEGVHMMGQPTLFVDPGNMSTDQFNNLNPNGVTVGSRRGIVLGEGGQPYLMSMAANMAAKEAMDQKEEQIISIGGKLVQSAGKNQTAEEARINAASENSILNTIAGNNEDAIESLLKLATEFEGGDPEEVEFNLNRDFFPDTMTAQEAAAYVMFADRGDVAQSDIRERLRRAGWIREGRVDEEIDEEIEFNGGGI